MKKILIATSVALCLQNAYMPNLYAKDKNTEHEQQETKNEMIGFGSGALIGAGLGGPVGAMIGGVFGLMIADDVNTDKQIELTTTELSQVKKNLVSKEQNIANLENELASVQQQQLIQLASFDDSAHDAYIDELSNFETSLQFKTASFSLEDIYTEQLNSIASILKSYPQLTVNVVGYADQRGDEDYNRALSEQRADAVKAYLISKNVKEEQIMITGAGEITLAGEQLIQNDSSSVTSVNIEDLFFARKVDISLVKTKQNMTAAN